MLYNSLSDWQLIVASILTTVIVSLAFTPLVKRFAISVGAIDVPGNRHIHNRPIPRMGGIAIVVSFLFGLLMFANIAGKTTGIVLGVIIIAIMGALDDLYNLSPWVKLVLQIFAGLVAIKYGVVLDSVTSLFGTTVFVNKFFSILLTLLWIVACTNAVNLIDGLDGLACGITAISSCTMLVVSLLVSDLNVTIILACLFGACVGFLPYNMNPAKIFMGDVGSQTLGFILATVSTVGLFKMHAVVTILVPLFALAVPLADTIFAIVRRLSKGQSPFKADKGHFHHRLLALGMTQRQVVGVLCVITLIMGLISILMTATSSVLKICCTIAVFLIALLMWVFMMRKPHVEINSTSLQSDNETDVKIYDKKSEERES